MKGAAEENLGHAFTKRWGRAVREDYQKNRLPREELSRLRETARVGDSEIAIFYRVSLLSVFVTDEFALYMRGESFPTDSEDHSNFELLTMNHELAIDRSLGLTATPPTAPMSVPYSAVEKFGCRVTLKIFREEVPWVILLAAPSATEPALEPVLRQIAAELHPLQHPLRSADFLSRLRDQADKDRQTDDLPRELAVAVIARCGSSEPEHPSPPSHISRTATDASETPGGLADEVPTTARRDLDDETDSGESPYQDPSHGVQVAPGLGHPGKKQRIRWKLVIPVLVLPFVALALYQLASDRSSPKRLYYSQGIEALADGRLLLPFGDCAVDHYKKLSLNYPKSREAENLGERLETELQTLGSDAFERFTKESAQDIDWYQIREIYEFLTNHDPTELQYQARLAYSKAHLAFQSERYETALNGYRKALEYAPGWALAKNGAAKVHVREDSPYYDPLKAEELYKEVLDLDPDFVFATINLARLKMRQKKWSEAESYLLAAIRSDPDRSSIYRSMARVKEAQGELREAIRYYESSLDYEEDPAIIKNTKESVGRLQRRVR